MMDNGDQKVHWFPFHVTLGLEILMHFGSTQTLTEGDKEIQFNLGVGE
jgi:hypothetical protein